MGWRGRRGARTHEVTPELAVVPDGGVTPGRDDERLSDGRVPGDPGPPAVDRR